MSCLGSLSTFIWTETGKIVKLLQALYQISTSAVRVDDDITERFRTLTGVRQGYILSPQLPDMFSWKRPMFSLSLNLFLFELFKFLPCRRSRRVLYLTRFFLYPAGDSGRVLYLTRFFFLLLLLLSSSSSFFFFFLLATHLFHTLPYIWFWPNLLTVTGTLTTTHTLKMVGSGVTMGSLGSKRSFSPKTHQVLQIT